MKLRRFATVAMGVILAAAVVAGPRMAAAQQSPTSMSLAKELIALKGAGTMFDPLVAGVVEQAKGTFLRTNPNLAKDLNEVAAALRSEYGTRLDEIHDIMARAFVERFTEQELKDAVAFYKTPLGRKLVAQETPAMEEGMSRLQKWADQLSEQVVGRFRAEMKKRGHTI